MNRFNNGHKRRSEKRETAQKRDEERSQRTPQQQLALLDHRLGTGVGAQRERVRLMKLIEQQKNKKNGGMQEGKAGQAGTVAATAAGQA
ncbi:MAG: hypothetical protein MN733_32990 [Nitrososphaera sp.]|nr:hypothetical protein [Nitrososphaera sp.]